MDVAPGAEVTCEEITWESLEFKPLQVEAKLQISEPLDVPAHCSLLATSSRYGYAVCGTSKGFAFALLKDIRSTLKAATKNTVVPLSELLEVEIADDPVHHVKLSADQLVVVICTAAGVLHLYDVKGTTNEAPPTFIKMVKLPGPVLDIHPNPEAMPDAAAVLLMDGRVMMVDFSEHSKPLPLKDVTSISWSRKGKQLACGLKNGNIVQITPEGAERKRIPAPGEVTERKVSYLYWMDTTTFVIMYGPHDPEDQSPGDFYVITLTGTPKVTTYHKLADTLFAEGDRQSHYYMEHLRALGGKIMHLIAYGNANSTELAFVGCDLDGSWANWNLGEGMGISMPLDANEENTSLVGLAVDATNEDSLPPATPDEPPIAPVPIMLTYTNVGHLLAYHCLDKEAIKKNEPCEMMTKAEEIPASATPRVPPQKPQPAAAIVPTQIPVPKTVTPLFGAPAATQSQAGATFGAALGAKPTLATAPPSFGAKAPEQGAKPAPSFGGFGAASNASEASGLAKPAPSFGGFGATKPSEGAAPPKAAPLFPGLGPAKPSEPTGLQKPRPLFGTPAAQSVPTRSFGGFGTSTPAPGGIAAKQSPTVAATATTGFASLALGSGAAKNAVSSTPIPVPAKAPARAVPSKAPGSALAASQGVSRQSPIPTVQSVVKPALTPKRATKSQPAQTMQPLQTVVPRNDDSPETMQSKFEELYFAFCEEMDNFGKRLRASGEVVKKAAMPSSSGDTENNEDWTLADLPTLLDRTEEIFKKAKRYDEQLSTLDAERRDLANSIPQETTLADECKRRLDALHDPKTAKHVRDAPLGPEDEELRNNILKRARSVERSFQLISDYMEKLRCDERDNDNRMLLKKPDWQTICGVANHITRGTENHLRALNTVQVQLQTLLPQTTKPPARTPQTPLKTPRKSRGFGLHDLSDSDSERDETEVTGAAVADAVHQRIAFRKALKTIAVKATGKVRINKKAHENHATLHLKDPEAFAKARAAMLMPPGDLNEKPTPGRGAPKSTRDILSTINSEMNFPEVKKEPVAQPEEPSLQKPTFKPQAGPTLTFGFGSLGQSTMTTPTKLPKAPVVNLFGKPIPGQGESTSEISTKPPATSHFGKKDADFVKVEQPLFAQPTASTPVFAVKQVARKLSFAASDIISESPELVSRPSSGLGSDGGWVDVKVEPETEPVAEDSSEQGQEEETFADDGRYAQVKEEETQVDEQEDEEEEVEAAEEGEPEEEEGVEEEEVEEEEYHDEVEADEEQEGFEEQDEEGYAAEESVAEEEDVTQSQADEILATEHTEEFLQEEEFSPEGTEDGELTGDATEDQSGGQEENVSAEPESEVQESPSIAEPESGDVDKAASDSVIEDTEEAVAEPSGQDNAEGDVVEKVTATDTATEVLPDEVIEPTSPPEGDAQGTPLEEDMNAMQEEGDGMQESQSTAGLENAFGSGFGALGGQVAKPSTTSSPFGTFGSSAGPSTSGFGSFGQSPAAGGFGSAPSSSVGFGQTAVPAFGQSPAPSGTTSAAAVFGQTPPASFGQTSSFGRPLPAASAFGQGVASPAFGQTGFGSGGGTSGGFGSPFSSMATAVGVQFGSSSSPMGSSGFGPSAFGTPAGNATQGGAPGAFGATPTGLGANIGGLASMANSIKQAGQSGGFGAYASKPSGFAAYASPSGSSPGFGGGFGSQQTPQERQGGFGGFGAQQPSTSQPFGFGGFAAAQPNQQAQSVFGSGGANSSPFGAAQQQPAQQQTAFGGGGGFGAPQQGSGFGFGSSGGFGSAQPQQQSAFGSSTPQMSGFGQAATGAPSVFGASTPSPGGVFGSSSSTQNKFSSFGQHRG